MSNMSNVQNTVWYILYMCKKKLGAQSMYKSHCICPTYTLLQKNLPHPTSCGSTLFYFSLCPVLRLSAVPFSACTSAGPKIVLVPSHLSLFMFVCIWKIIMLFKADSHCTHRDACYDQKCL